MLLQAIRLQGAPPGAELARVTQLTAQTVSIIAKRLEADGLLLRGAPPDRDLFLKIAAE